MPTRSFDVAESDAREADAWAVRLGVERAERLRHALRAHMGDLTGWGPAEDWADWEPAAVS